MSVCRCTLQAHTLRAPLLLLLFLALAASCQAQQCFGGTPCIAIVQMNQTWTVNATANEYRGSFLTVSASGASCIHCTDPCSYHTSPSVVVH